MDAICYMLEKQLKNSDNSDLSLYSGQTGILLYYGIYNRNAPKEILKENLQNLSWALSKVKNFTFDKGVTGIGYALQFLSNRGLLSFINESEIFRYLDDQIYNDVANHRSIALSLFSENSALSRAMYFYHRIKGDGEENPYRILANKECLILLVTEIKELVSIIISHHKELVINRPVYLFELGQCFVLLYHILLTGINKNYCQETLLFIREYIYSFFNSKERSLMGVFSLNLLYSYVYVAFHIRDKCMQQNSIKWINDLYLYFTSVIETNRDRYMLNKICELCSIKMELKYQFVDISNTTFSYEKTMEYFLAKKIDCDLLLNDGW